MQRTTTDEENERIAMQGTTFSSTQHMIDVIFPTRTEARHFDAPEGVRTHFCGVGLTDAAIFIAGLLAKEERPEAVVMGGIAGVYAPSRFKIGDTVIVEREREADLGFFYPDGFRLLARMDNVLDFPISEWITCPWIDERITLPRASSNSMNAAMAPFAPTDDADIENMEGAPFFKACVRAGVPFFELRTISNEVDLNRKEWDRPVPTTPLCSMPWWQGVWSRRHPLT